MNDTPPAEPDEPPSARDAPPAPDITFFFEAPAVDPPADRWLPERFSAAVRGAGVGPVTLAVRVVGDAEMSRMHALHSGVPGPTDVLTFDNRDAAGEMIDGDLVLCRDEAVRRANEYGHDARLELLLYALHGLLHLDGEDDHDPAAHRRMHEREDRILGAIGVGAVFSPGAKK